MWSVIFALIPARYLYGAGAAIAALLLGVATWKWHDHALKADYFAKGAAYARDSAAVATIARLRAQHQADEARADSTYAAASHADTVFRVALQSKMPPRVVSMTPVSVISPVSPDSDLEQSIPLSRLVRIVTAEPDTGYVTPNMAKLIVWQDTVIYQCCHRTVTVDSAVALALQWKKYGTSEHLVRLGSDSLAAAYAERLHEVQLTQSHSSVSTVKQITGLVLALGAGYFVAKHVR